MQLLLGLDMKCKLHCKNNLSRSSDSSNGFWNFDLDADPM